MTSKEALERIENFIYGSPISKEYREKLTECVETIKKDLEIKGKQDKIMCKPIQDLMKDLEILDIFKNWAKEEQDNLEWEFGTEKGKTIEEWLNDK